MARGGASAALLVLALLGQLQSTSAGAGAQPTTQPPTPTGGGSFFRQAGQALWSRDAVAEEHLLHARRFDDWKEFGDSPDLATYLGLRPVESVHIPLPLNIIFVGFSGDGNYGVDFKAEEMADWFENLDHVVPHIYIPEAELRCQEDGLCGGWHTPSRAAVASHVHYNLSCHTHELGAGVAEAFERALGLFSRPVDPANPGGPHQVDAALMETFVTGMLTALGLQQSGYTIVVLNPKWDPERPRYGYRVGLSAQEAKFLAADEVVREHSSRIPYAKLPEGHDEFGANEGDDDGWHWYRPKGKFHRTDKRMEAEAWLGEASKALQKHEETLARIRRALGEEHVAGGTGASRLDFLRRVSSTSSAGRDRLFKVLKEWTAEAASEVLNPEEGCLVDTWVAHSRWTLIDLTAGAEDWGPRRASSGGLRTRHSMPSLEDYFPTAGGGGDADAELGAQRRLLGRQEDSAMARVEAEARRHAASAARGESLKHAHAEAQGGYAPGMAPDDTERVEDESLVALRAEHDVYRHQYERNCEGVEAQALSAHCRHLVDSLAALDKDITQAMGEAVGRHGQDSEKGKQRMAQLQARLFGSSAGVTAAGVEADALRRRDAFLAQLGALLSRAIRHTVVPPTATWYEGDAVWDAPQEVRLPAKARAVKDAFDVGALRRELRQLQLPGQEYTVASRPLALADDPTLAAALGVALRPGVDAASGEATLSLDSSIIHKQIRQRSAPSARSSHSMQATKDVPIFVFLVSREVPIFIDGRLLAKSLPDSIIAVQNIGGSMRGPHPSGLACGSKLLALSPNAALQATVAAVAQHLAGRLPPHLGYSPVHGAVTHDWAWCTGATAQSLTAPGWRMGQMARDAAARHATLRVLDSSVHRVNRAVRLLSQEATVYDVYASLNGAGAPPARALLDAFERLLGHWRTAVKDAEALDHAAMLTRLKEVEAATEGLDGAASALLEALHPSKCTRRRGLQLGLGSGALAVALLGGVGAAAWRVWPGRRGSKKPKIN
mmetsp:Transcript_14116/g.36560  ORF Transcript_14116/g.36560 Transcript_14116/m.36560 type:complete len:1008 (+) Transcript_14116:343-3366(+)